MVNREDDEIESIFEQPEVTFLEQPGITPVGSDGGDGDLELS